MTTTEPTVLKETIGAAIGRIPSGVYILTAKDGEHKAGMLASWVMQAGFEPPSVTVAIHPDREVYKLIERTGRFCINVMSSDNMSMMKVFGKYSEEQFEQVKCREVESGFILPDTVAALECRVVDKVDHTDHHVFVAEVVNAEYMNPEQDPLVHLRKSGFHY